MRTASAETQKPPATPARLGVRFTETMTGHVSLGETDPRRGHRQGLAEKTSLTFRLTIAVDDVRRFLSEPAHAASARGWVECDALGGRLSVQHGEFNLFVADSPTSRRMLYLLWFADATGHPLTLRAHKEIHDDAGADAWSDTTTLFAHVLIGHVAGDDADSVVTAAGVLRIRPLDFARQLTTFRASGPSVVGRASALVMFGRFFFGQLWRMYGLRLRPSHRDPG